MYLPDAFRFDDREALWAHALAHPFATVITHGERGILASHLPLLVDRERLLLRGHLARENAQLAHFQAGAAALAIFGGPHAYVSPSVYEEPGVPTWNYVVVHARGAARVVDEDGLRAVLADSVTRFETGGWSPPADLEALRPLLDAIAGFEIAIEQLEGKCKLSQNRSAVDQTHVADWLERGDGMSREVAALMRARRPVGPVKSP
ncbi:MAG: FMN-binding negative transcriptional regulator [Polyangiaceae bacterium]|jgi:transcriptional regulator